MEHIDAVTPTPSFPFIPLTIELPPKELDVASLTVLRYFEAERCALATGYENDKREQADAFDHLVAICYRAVQPYFLRDRHGSLTVIDVPQFDSIKGDRTGHSRRKEGAALDATREWIQGWLLRFLAPYHDKSESELIEAADGDSFRYIGRKCKLRLKSTVCRKLEREENERTIYVAACACGVRDIKQRRSRRFYRCNCGLLVPYIASEYPAFTGFVGFEIIGEDGEAEECIGTERQDAPSSLGRDSFEKLVYNADQARKIVLANVDELTKLDLFTGLMAILSTVDHVLNPRYFNGLVTRTIAGMRGISEGAARAYKRKFRDTMNREYDARNPLIQSIFREVEMGKRSYIEVGSRSSAHGSDRQLLHEARQLYTQFANECRADKLQLSVKDAETQELRLTNETELSEEMTPDVLRALDKRRFLDDFKSQLCYPLDV